MAHETIKYGLNDVPDLFNTCFIKGTVLAVNDFDNTADISTEVYGILYGVPIFYHCPDESDTSKGYLAFNEDDEVVVIVPNAVNNLAPNPNKIKIVGFWDNQPRPCGGEGFFEAVIGNRAVIWDISKRTYAQDILDDNGFVIEDNDWPVLFTDLDDWHNLTAQIGTTGVTQWGGSDLTQQFASCSCASNPPNCVDDTDSDSGLNTVTGDTDTCSCLTRRCDTVNTDFCDSPFETKKEKETTTRQDIVDTDNLFHSGSSLWGSYKPSVNGNSVVLTGHRFENADFQIDEVTVQNYTCSAANPPTTWTYDYTRITAFDSLDEVRTPFGIMFEGIALSETSITEIREHSGSGVACQAPADCTVGTCTGFQKVVFSNDPVVSTRYQRRFYQEAVGGFAEGKVIGAFLVGFGKQYTTFQKADCSGADADTDPDRVLDAVGVIGYYEDNTTIDLNDETETPNVREGLKNLIIAYHDDNADDFRTIQSLQIRHRKYIVDL